MQDREIKVVDFKSLKGLKVRYFLNGDNSGKIDMRQKWFDATEGIEVASNCRYSAKLVDEKGKIQNLSSVRTEPKGKDQKYSILRVVETKGGLKLVLE